ncbi:MAG: TIGR03761 family integrating conjugative element protein [Candidatus Thiodiazotropha endolucinida]|nr:TIGR03761 family integrating conjugative element protein [Candidatus Thiodiazotropha taylori]MCG8097362.1 TIGR03761 family integrating conjugative element protein [Candidatus Thiodiazotropha endolucinida]
MTLQTRQAQQLVRGRNRGRGKQQIIGLGLFAEWLRVIWQAARDDDPYADWWLIKVHEAIADREALLQALQRELDEQLAQMGSIEVTVAESEHPYRMPLRFANPYAYQAARLVSKYDALVCAAVTACRIGVLDGTDRQHVIDLGGRKMRSLFIIPRGYRFLRIDRAGVLKGGGKSNQAVQSMGVVPEDVLSGERRAPLAPRRRQLSPGFSENIGLHPSSSVSDTNMPATGNDDD